MWFHARRQSSRGRACHTLASAIVDPCRWLCRFSTSAPVPVALPLPAGMLEGMSAIEAQAYQQLAALGATPVRRVLTAGGGAVNDKWTAMRAAALGVPVAAAVQGGSQWRLMLVRLWLHEAGVYMLGERRVGITTQIGAAAVSRTSSRHGASC